ncbi:hypothetical protein NR402_11895 [Acidithiobacillus ferrooxidans]|jgi:hypothetical protein|uniref:hypothetical protein n=1 Tax=Acidithiobacillus TaxID=119977 RepID=UPI001C07BAD9|nr:hypothetical protein [Acidithiobacillus ferrooxidans]MBU2809787.1 hypothetical protein [Acidithiobacillus ferrooxidans F221]MCR2830976.1 hypothetical protein [Acidithiobacillus ferrooxidans]
MSTVNDAEKKVAEVVHQEEEHLGHNFAENFPGLVEEAEHLGQNFSENFPGVTSELKHLEGNFEENFPGTGHSCAGHDAPAGLHSAEETPVQGATPLQGATPDEKGE